MAGTYKVNGDKLTGLTVYSTTPIGTVIATVSTSEVGFLAFDGNEYNGADYPELYEKVKNLTAFQSETEGYFKLPNLAGRTIQQAENELGVLVEAGLPNIKGEFKFKFSDSNITTLVNSTSELSGAFVRGTEHAEAQKTIGQTNSSAANGADLGFDASQSNPIYSDDCDTVQPPAITLNFLIKAVDYVSLPQNAIDDEHTTTGNVHSAQKTGQVIDTKIDNAKAWKEVFDNPDNSIVTTVTLSDDITNYNEVMFVCCRSAGNVFVSLVLPVSLVTTLTMNNGIAITGYNEDHVYLKYTDSRTFTETDHGALITKKIFVR